MQHTNISSLLVLSELIGNVLGRAPSYLALTQFAIASKSVIELGDVRAHQIFLMITHFKKIMNIKTNVMIIISRRFRLDKYHLNYTYIL